MANYNPIDIMDAIAEDDFQMRMMKVAHHGIFNAAIFSLAVLSTCSILWIMASVLL